MFLEDSGLCRRAGTIPEPELRAEMEVIKEFPHVVVWGGHSGLYMS